MEEGERKLVRGLLVKDGRGQCVLRPEEVKQVRPESKPFRLEVEPIVTLEQLKALQVETSIAILADLAQHQEPFVRQLSVEMLAETGSPEAIEPVRKAKGDLDPSVRNAAVAAERKLTEGGPHGGRPNA